jgi:hypothetical protein
MMHRAARNVFEQMRNGARIVRLHGRHGLEFYVVPGNAGAKRISDETAHTVLGHPDVIGCKDCLWPGLDQTFKLRATA